MSFLNGALSCILYFRATAGLLGLCFFYKFAYYLGFIFCFSLGFILYTTGHFHMWFIDWLIADSQKVQISMAWLHIGMIERPWV